MADALITDAEFGAIWVVGRKLFRRWEWWCYWVYRFARIA